MMPITHFDYGARHLTPWHEHPAGQLYWLSHGMMVIETARAQWTVTSGTLGWFAAGQHHRAWVPGRAQGHSLYLTPESGAPFAPDCAIYGADAFMLALLTRLCRATSAGHQRHLVSVLGYELAHSPQLPLQLRLPLDRRARNVAEELLKNPASGLSQSELAQRWGLSVRNLSRLFQQQTGLSFSQWRQQAKVVTSLQWVQAGRPIGEVAALSGYGNISAYIEAFRQRFGRTPGQFRQGE